MPENWFAVFYALGRITLGLLLHPYQTMQSLVQEKVFVWMTLLPTGVLAIVTVFWRFIFVPVMRYALSCQDIGPWGCSWLPFVSNWLVFFCIYWQVMLLYLLLRFTSAFRER